MKWDDIAIKRAEERERQKETGEKETEIAQIQSNARDRGSEKERGEQRKEFDVKQTWSYYSTSRYNSISSKFFFFWLFLDPPQKDAEKLKKRHKNKNTIVSASLFPFIFVGITTDLSLIDKS